MKEIRTYDLVTQKEIAKAMNISTNTYKQYELQYWIIPIKHLCTFCDFFHVSIDYIFDFTNAKEYLNSKKTTSFKIVGIRLKEFRKENKITQTKLACELKTSQSNIAGYETGKYILSTPFLYAICKKYGISADYLLGKIDTPKYLKKA